MLRALAPLPRFDEITFLRKGSREFVTGSGPFPVTIVPWLGGLFLVMAAGFAVVGTGLTFAAYDPQLILGHPLPMEDDWLRYLGPALLVPAIADVGLSMLFRNIAEKEKRLSSEGGLITGELVSAWIRASKNGNYLQAECRFVPPGGKPIKAMKSVARFDPRLKSPPAAGSTILILYDNPKLWQVL